MSNIFKIYVKSGKEEGNMDEYYVFLTPNVITQQKDFVPGNGTVIHLFFGETGDAAFNATNFITDMASKTKKNTQKIAKKVKDNLNKNIEKPTPKDKSVSPNDVLENAAYLVKEQLNNMGVSDKDIISSSKKYQDYLQKNDHSKNDDDLKKMFEPIMNSYADSEDEDNTQEKKDNASSQEDSQQQFAGWRQALGQAIPVIFNVDPNEIGSYKDKSDKSDKEKNKSKGTSDPLTDLLNDITGNN